MNNDQLEAHRKRFHEIARSKVDLSNDGSGNYWSADAQRMWQGYLLCAENIDIEIPTISMSCCINSTYKNGFDQCAKEVSEKLESQGIKVKK